MKKEIIASDAVSALGDAIADLLHVYEGDEVAVGEVEYEVWKTARMNYQAEVEEAEITVVKDIDA